MQRWFPPESPSTLAVAVAAVAGGALLANSFGVIATAVGRASYWPPGERDWRFYLQWTLAQTVTVAVLVVAVLDWNSLGLPRVPSLAIGLALFVPGFAVAIAAGFDLGAEETAGLSGELRTDGWYRYSRNPQYVGYLVASVGFALVANSVLVTTLCALYVCWWVLLPFVEEPWLRAEYGAAYERYADRTPRFVGWRTIRALTTPDRRRSAEGE